MRATEFRRMYSARLAIGIAKRAKAASANPVGRHYCFALRFPGGVSQHPLEWEFLRERRETEVALAVLMIMNREAVRQARWET